MCVANNWSDTISQYKELVEFIRLHPKTDKTRIAERIGISTTTLKQKIAEKACGYKSTTELSRQNSLGSARIEFPFNSLVCGEYLAWVPYSSKRFVIVFVVQSPIDQ